MEKENFILNCDVYKTTHWLQYPSGTQHVYSYLESRGGEFDETVFFGLQYLLKRHFEGRVLEQWMIDHAEKTIEEITGYKQYFNRDGWQHILDQHNGYLPIKIRAIPEGTPVKTRNVLLTIENTDPKVPWLTNFCETLLMQLWYPTTVCTLSQKIKRLIGNYSEQTGGAIAPVSLNDFGFRGASSKETAAIGGMSHLVNFAGTDNIAGVQATKNYYEAESPAMSVMASEHSTTTIYGEEKEAEAFEHFIDSAPNDAIVSIVADSYDYYRAVDYYFGQKLAQKIMNRSGRVVIRPDSGHPPQVVVQTLKKIDERFPCKDVTKAGYKLIHPNIGIIYGDWMSYEMIDQVCFAMVEAGYAIDPRNIVFGMGGKLIQQVNRDTQKFALKCSAAVIDGEDVEVYKQPVTDVANKASKKGRMKLAKVNGGHGGSFMTVSEDHPAEDYMQEVFKDGKILVETTFKEVQGRANAYVYGKL